MKISPALNTCLVCIVLVMASCSIGYISINVLEPAKIIIPASIKKVSLFPGAGIPDPYGTIDSIDNIGLEPDYNYNRIKRGYMEGIYDIMSASPRFLNVIPADTVFEDFLATGMISWDELRQLCTRDSTDAVLILKKAVCQDTLVRYNYPGLECVLIYRLICRTKWTFYQPFVRNEFPGIVFADTSIFEQENENCDPHALLDNVPDILYDAFYHTGAQMGENISPTWHNDIQRILFTGPGNQMRKASFFALNDQWNQAAVIWNGLTESRNRKLASHASFNLALAWEQDDDLDQAVLWVSHADSLISNGKTLAYKKILESRLKNRALLDQQMTRN